MDESLPSTSTSTCPALDILEKKLYLNDSFVSDVKTTLVQFSNFWNSLGRLSLLNASKEESEELVFLLLTLKKNIKYTLSEVGKHRIKKDYDFVCTECDESIHVPPDGNLWDSLQTHQHVEEALIKLENVLSFQNSIQSTSNGISESMPTLENTSSESDQNNVENGDSGIEYCELGGANGHEYNNYSSEDENINTFRFNFKLSYDKMVESKLYPESIMKSVRKMDQIENFTVQKTGPFRAVCLICYCDIISRGRLHKMGIMDHVAGQRHLKNSRNLINLNALQKYHEMFLNLDPDYQAHQVYFVIENIDILKCILCRQQVTTSKIEKHIMSQSHKKFVLDLFRNKNNTYHLTDMQVKLYGKEPNMIEQTISTNADKVPKGAIDKKGNIPKKKDSDSNHSPDVMEPEHIIVKSVENPKSTNVMDLIPYRYKDHKVFLNETQTTVLCRVCKQHIVKDIEGVKKHLKSNSHLKNSKIAPATCNFFCEICNLKFSDENTWTKHFVNGANRHVNMAESRKDRVTEFECLNCHLIIFGDDISLIRHTSSYKLKRERQPKEIKLPEAVTKMFRSPDVISTEGLSLTNEAKYMSEHNDKTMECCKQIETTLKAVFEECKAHPFGSRMSGLGNKFSDLDVFIDTGDMFNGDKNQDSYTQVHIVRKAANVLARHKDLFQEVIQIPTARTPIVKLYHEKTQIHCDLSFRHGLSVENTKYLRFCIEMQPVTQPFILLLKKWSASTQMSEHITTYALAIMAIFYLQVNNYLLSVKKIKELNSSQALVINGWETINYTVPIEIMRNHVNVYEHSLHKLLRDFFQYYAKFCYNEDVVCPLLGYTIKKKIFHARGERFPPEMQSYVQQLCSSDPEQFRSLSYMCIQDPFDLSHNLTKACQPNIVNKFKTLCDLSVKHLSTKDFPY